MMMFRSSTIIITYSFFLALCILPSPNSCLSIENEVLRQQQQQPPQQQQDDDTVVVSGKIESCIACKLNSLPPIPKDFFKSGGDVENYQNIIVEHKRGQEPILMIYHTTSTSTSTTTKTTSNTTSSTNTATTTTPTITNRAKDLPILVETIDLTSIFTTTTTTTVPVIKDELHQFLIGKGFQLKSKKDIEIMQLRNRMILIQEENIRIKRTEDLRRQRQMKRYQWKSAKVQAQQQQVRTKGQPSQQQNKIERNQMTSADELKKQRQMKREQWRIAKLKAENAENEQQEERQQQQQQNRLSPKELKKQRQMKREQWKLSKARVKEEEQNIQEEEEEEELQQQQQNQSPVLPPKQHPKPRQQQPRNVCYL